VSHKQSDGKPRSAPRIDDVRLALAPLFRQLRKIITGRDQTTPQLGSQTKSAMSEAQRIDFKAACDGKITWRQYYAKWGSPGGGPSL
jgi:hypothetical protein